MAFREVAFNSATFVHRTEAVAVPGLADWFDGEPVWTVRGLTAHEFARCVEAAEKRNTSGALMEALMAGSKTEKVRELREALALTEETPAEISKRLEMLRIGSVDPAISHDMAVKLAEVFAIEFYQLTNVVTRLTGQGQCLGKPAPSGQKQT